MVGIIRVRVAAQHAAIVLAFLDEGVGGGVSEVELTLHRQAASLGIFQTCQPHALGSRKLFASGGSAHNGLPGPVRFSNTGVMLSSNQPNPGLRHEVEHEQTALFEPFGEILRGEDVQVDLSAQQLGGSS